MSIDKKWVFMGHQVIFCFYHFANGISRYKENPQILAGFMVWI